MPHSSSADSLIVRHPGNPVLTADMWPYRVNSVFNPGAIRLKDGTTLLLCRVEDHRGHSHLCAARSANGVNKWKIDPAPTLEPQPDKYPEELWGIEDARITCVGELGKYAVAYTAYSRAGPCVSLALTSDFHDFERIGVIMPPEDKDAALLPHRIGKYWALIHRPTTTAQGAHVWISYSPDLRHWGSHHVVLPARRGGWWDAMKVGMAPPPVETPRGWLLLYHGVRTTAGGCLYRLGLALLDDETPEKCLLRGDSWLFGPQMPYEQRGDVGNVVFPCGYTVDEDGDGLNIYYGAADSCIGLARTRISELLGWLTAHGHEPEPGE
jgi:predicted GH43/DUF377 family glycosyl hydrolase